MNRLNRKVEYALMALKVMAQKRAGELTSAKEVVDQTGCPFDATARVLQQMAQKGILRSEQGAHGGYVLIRDLARVSFFELNEVILGPVALAKCLQDSDCDLKSRCNILSPISVLNRKMAEFYQDLSVGELLRVKERGEAPLVADLSEVSP
ncbi:MAG: Rrf2 family transcriptional regulator [Bdellovibrionales bacterium]|nr:Rrf2 family transcriptional regulator [Bdellovibrionales bacterium]